MSSVKTPASESFRDYLIKSLQDHNEAAVYLEAILEEDNPEPDLLKSALLDVSEAIGKLQLPHEQYQQHRYELDQILSQPGSQAIYSLANWLNALGLKLTVAIAEQTPEE